jgi:hypothetical protein
MNTNLTFHYQSDCLPRKVISKYLNAKQDVQSDLLQLLNALSNILVVAKVEVEAALTRCTELTMLCDTMTDCKKVIDNVLLIALVIQLTVCAELSRTVHTSNISCIVPIPTCTPFRLLNGLE